MADAAPTATLAPGPAPTRCELADGTRVVADAVVLATPAWASGELLRPVAPLAAADLSSIEYVTTATASVAYRADQVGHDLKGFGFVVPRAEDRPVMATTWSSSKFDGRAPAGTCCCAASWARRPRGRGAAGRRRDGRASCAPSCATSWASRAEPEFVQIFRWPRGMPQYRVGHVELVGHIEAAVRGVPGIELAGGAYHGIGIGDCLREGAAAAERAIEHVRGLPEDEIPPQPAGPARRRRPDTTRAPHGSAHSSRAPRRQRRVLPRDAVDHLAQSAAVGGGCASGGDHMSWVVGATIWFVIWLICLWLVWRMVDRKDLNRALWIILCIFFPVLILIIVAILPAKQRGSRPRRCPDSVPLGAAGAGRRPPPFVRTLSTCRPASRSSGAARACSCRACCTSPRSGR